MTEQTQAPEVDTQEDTTSPEEARVRVSYTPDAANNLLTVKYDQEKMDFAVAEELYAKHEGLKEHLALLGLISYFQRESSKFRDADKLTAIDKAYTTLEEQGTEAFKRKAGGGPRGPRKADKIAALAAIKGVTPAAVEKALASKSKEEQDELLNHKKVLAKLEKMKGELDDLTV